MYDSIIVNIHQKGYMSLLHVSFKCDDYIFN